MGGRLEFDLLLGDVHSLKEKRSVVRPILAEVRRRFEVSVAEVEHLELHRRAGIGVAAVSPDRAHIVELLDNVERLVAYRPEIEVLSARRTSDHVRRRLTSSAYGRRPLPHRFGGTVQDRRQHDSQPRSPVANRDDEVVRLVAGHRQPSDR